MCLPISTVVHSSAYGSDASDDRAGDRARRRVVRAPDHQRPPHDEHGRLDRGRASSAAAAARCTRPRAGSRRARTRRSASPRATVSTIMIARHKSVDHERARREAACGVMTPDSTGCGEYRLRGIVLAVGADLEVEQVVHQVVRHVREHDADGREREPAPRDARRPGRRRAARRPRRRRASSAARPRGSGRATSTPGPCGPAAGSWSRARTASCDKGHSRSVSLPVALQ